MRRRADSDRLQLGDIDFMDCSLLCETRLKVFRTNCGRGIIKVADSRQFPHARGSRQ